MVNVSSLKKMLVSIVGPKSVTVDQNDCFFYSQDSSPLISNELPTAVVRPFDVNQVSRILRYCNDQRIFVTFRGAGTSLSGNSIPLKGGIVLDTTAMNRIIEFNPESKIVVVEPGVVCDDLNFWLKDKGLFFAPDPGSSTVCTIGGMVANNSGGIQAAKYGVTKSHVLWLEAVLADGTIAALGSRVLKSSSSFSLQDLLVGSEGCLAFVSKVALKLIPIPETRQAFVIAFDDMKGAVNLASEIQSSGIVPNMMEFMDDETTNAVLHFINDDRYPFNDKTLIVLELDGKSSEVVENSARVRNMLSILQDSGTNLVAIEVGPKERDAVIKLRKSALPALARLNRTVLIEDCSVLLDKISSVVQEIKEYCSNVSIPNFHIAIFGHIGDGNLHPTFVFDGMDNDHVNALFKSMNELYTKIIPDADGSITGEHGIGIIKAPYLKIEHGSAFELMMRIKTIFDPNGILNPMKGKSGFIPESLEAVFDAFFPFNKEGNFGLSKLFNYDNNCMKCGFCRLQCPSLSYHGWETYSPRARLSLLQGIALNRVELGESLAKKFMACMLCDRCHQSCPAGLETSSIFEKFRESFSK